MMAARVKLVSVFLALAGVCLGADLNVRYLTATTALSQASVPATTPLRWYQGESVTFDHWSLDGASAASWTNLTNLVAVWTVGANKTLDDTNTNVYLLSTGTITAASGKVRFLATPAWTAMPASNYWSYVTMYQTDPSGVTNNFLGILQRAPAVVQYRETSTVYAGPWTTPTNFVDLYARSQADSALAGILVQSNRINTIGVVASNAQTSASSALTLASNAMPIAGGTFTGTVYQSAYGTDAPASNELVTASFVRGLAMQGAEWYFTTNLVVGYGQKTTNFVTLSGTVPSPAFTNTTAAVTANMYIAGGVTTNTYTSLRSPVTFDCYLARAGGTAASFIPVHAELYYIYNGTTNHLGDWEVANQTVNSTAPMRYEFVVSFVEPSITGSVQLVGYLKAGTPTGPAAGINIYGGGTYPSHMDIAGTDISGIETDPRAYTPATNALAIAQALAAAGHITSNEASVLINSIADTGTYYRAENAVRVELDDGWLEFHYGDDTLQLIKTTNTVSVIVTSQEGTGFNGPIVGTVWTNPILSEGVWTWGGTLSDGFISHITKPDDAEGLYSDASPYDVVGENENRTWLGVAGNRRAALVPTDEAIGTLTLDWVTHTTTNTYLLSSFLTNITINGVTGTVSSGMASLTLTESGSTVTNMRFWSGPAASQSVTNPGTVYFTW